MTYVPALRAEVSLVEADDGRTLLRDPLFEREIALDAPLRAVARAVDGRRTVDAVLGAAAEAQVTRPLAVRALRSLLLLGMFDGTYPDAVDALRARRDGLELLRGAVLPEARFECQGSGACCRAYSLGPIAPDDESRVMALGLAAAFPEAGGVYFESHALPGGGSARYLRRVDGGCVFLRDGRCGLHAHFGEGAKPQTCQLFPLSHVVRYDGAHVYDRAECSRFSASARAGEALARTPRRLLPVMRQERRLEHPIVQLDGSLVVDYALYAPLVQAALDECVAPGVASAEVIRALGRRAGHLASLLGELPIAAGALAVVSAQVLGVPRARFYVPTRPDNLAPGCRAVARVADALIRACDGVLAEIPEGHAQDYARDHARQVKPALHALRELTGALAEGRPAPDRIIAAGFVSTDVPDVNDTLRLSLRQGLFGRGALLDNRVQPALLRLAFIELLTRFGARIDAVADPVRGVVAALDGAHLVAQRALSLEPLQAVLRGAAEAAPATLEALPYVARWR